MKTYQDVDQLLDDCDAVLIITTTVHHFSLLKKAISKHKHIFVEKPIVADYLEMLELAALVRDYPNVIQIGHIERFNLMLQKAFSDPVVPWLINATRLSPFNPRVSDVSVIHDLMIHDIDSVLTLANSTVVDVQATGHSYISGLTDVCHVKMIFENGLQANLFAGRIYKDAKREMDIYYLDRFEHMNFQTRTATINNFERRLESFEEKDAVMIGNWPDVPLARSMWQKVEQYPENNAILSELTAFYEAVAYNKPVKVGVREAAETMHIISLIEEAMSKSNQHHIYM
ncbi:MAG TPA: Gfo/Idh/MocA family oxidoreductase [Alphaproteobacteria bacterium]|nr:Gfo/Idh/MocA family oxidoreductase [Alphaproteobacteria bacterium]